VVLHLPRSFEETARAGVAMADEVVLLVAPELFAVYSARRTVAAFGLGPARPYRVVINPYLRGGIGPDIVAGVLGQAPAGRIRFDPAVRRAQERGQLLGTRNRRAARDVETLARLVAPSSMGTRKRGSR
jgi:Flp pilus assembly CpaE family ATPase